MREKGTDKYVWQEFSRKQNHEHSTSITFVRLIVLDNKVVQIVIQLCEDELGVKRTVNMTSVDAYKNSE